MCRLGLPRGVPNFHTTLNLDESGIPIVSIFGEIDLATSNMFASALYEATSRAVARYVIVDVRGTEFMDIGGMNTLLDLHEKLRALSPGGPLRGHLLVVSVGHVKRLIELLDPEERLHLCLDLPEAKNALADLGNLGPSRN